MTEVFGDVAEVLATLNPSKIVSLKANDKMNNRVSFLVKKKKEGIISLDESSELERYLALDMLINLAKAKARLILAKWNELVEPFKNFFYELFLSCKNNNINIYFIIM